MLLTKISVFVLCLKLHSSEIVSESPKCGYESCNPTKDGAINVHMVPHTHNEIGWTSNFDEYYYGYLNFKAPVQYILWSVIGSLEKNPDRRFVYAETAYFWKWWKEQEEPARDVVRNLVNNGRLEMVGGSWATADEATTHYQSIIDEFTWGLRRLNDSLGVCGHPKVGWQIDTFGHSKEMASIMAQLGFDGVMATRIDHHDLWLKKDSDTTRMVWQGSEALDDDQATIFFEAFDTYLAPPKLCFDALCDDKPVIDDPSRSDYNLAIKWDLFKDHLENMMKKTSTKTILIPMGGDFFYSQAEPWFTNTDKLIKYVNSKQGQYHLLYSTPSCYLKAVHEEALKNNVTFLIKSDDFLPYSDRDGNYWTGFYTSRPALKRFERLGNNFLQVSKQLSALTGTENQDGVTSLREALGLIQHHNVITGTETTVTLDYFVRTLHQGIMNAHLDTVQALNTLINKNVTTALNRQPFGSCLLLNISECQYTEFSDRFVVTLYNPLSRSVDRVVRVPVLNDSSYDVTDPTGKQLLVQLVPIPNAVREVPGRKSIAFYELVFLATEVPGLGFKSYYVSKGSGDQQLDEEPPAFKGPKLSFNFSTGFLSKLVVGGLTLNVSQQFMYYRGATALKRDRPLNSKPSGAYVFQPLAEAQEAVDGCSFEAHEGPLLYEYHQRFSSWLSQVISVYSHDPALVEFKWMVGPLPDPIANRDGVEVISRFTTDLNSKSTFFTDSNGRETMTRVRNYRPTWKLKPDSQRITSNYYPVTSKISIRDDDRNLEAAILTDRAQGGSSLSDGQIELMLHRNSYSDDDMGVGEALNEYSFGEGTVVRGSHYLIAGSTVDEVEGKRVRIRQKQLAQEKILESWMFLSSTNDLSYQEYKEKYAMEYSSLKVSLPENVQILTLEAWKDSSLLIRVENTDEDINSKPASLDLKDLFSVFDVQSMKETTLGANQWLNQNSRLKFPKGESMEDFMAKWFESPDRHHAENKLVANLKNIMLGEFDQEDEGDAAKNIYKFTTDVDKMWEAGSKTWQADKKKNIKEFRDSSVKDDGFEIQLKPMQIRTFVVEILTK